MIDGQRCLGVVVARGGSKGLPGKNLADLDGRPLIAWAVDAALKSDFLDHVAVSSDDADILRAAGAAGAQDLIRRPAEMATDDAPVADALVHALESQQDQFDYLVLLAATSPLRTAADIDDCINACHPGAPLAVTVCETAKPVEWACRLTRDNLLKPVLPGDGLNTRRQDLTPAYQPNGAVYVVRRDWFLQHRRFHGEQTAASIMPADRSVDIDDEKDLMMARWYVQSGRADFAEGSKA